MTSVPILYPLKIPENQRFSGVFRGYKMGPLAGNGLIDFFPPIHEIISTIGYMWWCQIAQRITYPHYTDALILTSYVAVLMKSKKWSHSLACRRQHWNSNCYNSLNSSLRLYLLPVSGVYLYSRCKGANVPGITHLVRKYTKRFPKN